MQDFYDTLLDRYYSPPYDANATYSPSAIVKFNHLITRSTYSEEGNYHKKALYAPIILCCLGVSALAIFCLALLSRRCYEFCRCRIPRKRHRRTPDDKVNNLGCLMKDTKTENLSRKVRRWNNCVFYTFVVFFLMAVQLVYLSNAVFEGSMNQLSDSGQVVTAKINGIVAQAEELQRVDRALIVNYALALAQDPRCEDSLPEESTLIAALNSSLHQLGDSIDNITASSLPVNKDVERAERFLYDENDNDYTTAEKSLQVYLLCVWSVCMVSGLGLVASKLYGNINGMKVAMGFGVFVELLLIGGGLLYLWLVSVGADVCMDPARHVPDILSEHTHKETGNLMGHYIVCGDDDHVTEYDVPASATSLNDKNVTLLWNVAVSSHLGNYSAQLLEQILNQGSRACKDNTYLLAMKQLLYVNITSNVRDLDVLTACGANYNDVTSIFERSMCGYLYLSVAEVWVAQLMSAFCLFITLVSSSIAWQYYDHRHIHRVMLTPRDGFTDDDESESDTGGSTRLKHGFGGGGGGGTMVHPFSDEVQAFADDDEYDEDGERDMMFDVGSAPKPYHHQMMSGSLSNAAIRVHPTTSGGSANGGGGRGRAGGVGPPPALIQQPQQFNTRRVHEITHSINITKKGADEDEDGEDYYPNGGRQY